MVFGPFIFLEFVSVVFGPFVVGGSICGTAAELPEVRQLDSVVKKCQSQHSLARCFCCGFCFLFGLTHVSLLRLRGFERRIKWIGWRR